MRPQENRPLFRTHGLTCESREQEYRSGSTTAFAIAQHRASTPPLSAPSVLPREHRPPPISPSQDLVTQEQHNQPRRAETACVASRKSVASAHPDATRSQSSQRSASETSSPKRPPPAALSSSFHGATPALVQPPNDKRNTTPLRQELGDQQEFYEDIVPFQCDYDEDDAYPSNP